MAQPEEHDGVSKFAVASDKPVLAHWKRLAVIMGVPEAWQPKSADVLLHVDLEELLSQGFGEEPLPDVVSLVIQKGSVWVLRGNCEHLLINPP